MAENIEHEMYTTNWEWYEFAAGHSRSYALANNIPISKLCLADKLMLEPWWLYLPRVRLTGELKEYMSDPQCTLGNHFDNPREWYKFVQDYLNKFIKK